MYRALAAVVCARTLHFDLRGRFLPQKLSPEAAEERKTFLEQMNSEFARVYAEVKGAPLPKAAEGVGKRVGISADEFMSGATKNRRQEAITKEQQLMLDDIYAQEKEQDQILDQMSDALEGLKQLGNQIKDAVDASNKVLDDALDKVDKTAEQLDKVNDRMKETLKKVSCIGPPVCCCSVLRGATLKSCLCYCWCAATGVLRCRCYTGLGALSVVDCACVCCWLPVVRHSCVPLVRPHDTHRRLLPCGAGEREEHSVLHLHHLYFHSARAGHRILQPQQEITLPALPPQALVVCSCSLSVCLRFVGRGWRASLPCVSAVLPCLAPSQLSGRCVPPSRIACVI